MMARSPARAATLALGCALFVTIACSAVIAAESKTVMVRDARGRDVVIEQPRRIVAIGGAVTEILYALGLEDRIVGIDSTSLYPAHALSEKPNIGYMRQLSAEGVLSLNPELILAIEGAGPRETIDVLDSAKVPMVSIPEAFGGDSLVKKIRLVAQAMNVEARGACLADAAARDLDWLQGFRKTLQQPKRIMFVMSFLNDRAMVAGRRTAADEIIRLSGAVNAIDAFDGYKQINDEAIVAARPDIVLTIERGKGSVTADSIYRNAAFGMTPAAASKAFIAMDGLYLLGFGPRTAAAAFDLATKANPEQAAQTADFKPSVLNVNCRQ